MDRLMDKHKIIIRTAREEDAERILEIYEYYVKHTAISFECKPPSLLEFKERMRKIKGRYPYFVAVKNNRIAGYAYAGPFVGRAAYDWCAELTIYLDPKEVKGGIGKRLYQALEESLKNMGILNLYVCIGYPEKEDEYLTSNSADFHEHLGFKKAGEFFRCGYKFDRWYHMIWMEKIIGVHGKMQKPVSSYEEKKGEEGEET